MSDGSIGITSITWTPCSSLEGNLEWRSRMHYQAYIRLQFFDIRFHSAIFRNTYEQIPSDNPRSLLPTVLKILAELLSVRLLPLFSGNGVKGREASHEALVQAWLLDISELKVRLRWSLCFKYWESRGSCRRCCPSPARHLPVTCPHLMVVYLASKVAQSIEACWLMGTSL